MTGTPEIWPSRNLNVIQRALNRAGRPFGIAPFPVAWEYRSTDEPPLGRQIFETIARANYWGSEESISGPGSELARTARYRRALLDFLDREKIESFFDAPCGDLNWMREVLERHPMRYIGADVSPSVVATVKESWPDLDIRQFDICVDPFPDAQVWQCRDVLLHLSFEDIWAALANAARSNISFALITTYRSRMLRNLDIETGGWRYLDLERPPFHLPRPINYLADLQPKDFPRAVGIWPMDDVRRVVGRRKG